MFPTFSVFLGSLFTCQLQPRWRLCPGAVDKCPPQSFLTVRSVARWAAVDERPEILRREEGEGEKERICDGETSRGTVRGTCCTFKESESDYFMIG